MNVLNSFLITVNATKCNCIWFSIFDLFGESRFGQQVKEAQAASKFQWSWQKYALANANRFAFSEIFISFCSYQKDLTLEFHRNNEWQQCQTWKEHWKGILRRFLWYWEGNKFDVSPRDDSGVQYTLIKRCREKSREHTFIIIENNSKFICWF